MQNQKIVAVLSLCLPIVGLALFQMPAAGQTFTPRADFGAFLEPRGALMHGAGQDAGGFLAYSNAVGQANQPLVYMAYLALHGIQPNWSDGLRANLLQTPDRFTVLEIGLEFNINADPATDYEAQVAAGAYDKQIDNFISGLRHLPLPVYLRIGAEFNGAWEGYQPEPFKAAFRHVAERLRAANAEVATVWCVSIDGGRNFFDFYPGDDVVDWFAIDIFKPQHFADPDVASFLQAANAHNKPVMVGETTPEGVGADQPDSWAGWYDKFFNWLRANPGIKQFNYINWKWSDFAVLYNQPGWANWGDARLETPAAAPVLQQYVAALNDPVLLNSSTEASFRQLLNYGVTGPPPPPEGLTATNAPGGVSVQWSPVDDPSGIARYYVYRDGRLLDFTLALPYLDSTVLPGSATYEIAAMSRAGYLSPRTPAVAVDLAYIERMFNGGFESDLALWQFSSYDPAAVGNAVLDTSNPISGTASARIDVSSVSGTDWHLQFRQLFNMTSRVYTISFTARASQAASISVYLQQVDGDHLIYFSRKVALTGSPASFSFTYPAGTTSNCGLSLFVGGVPAGTSIWLDDVSLRESTSVLP